MIGTFILFTLAALALFLTQRGGTSATPPGEADGDSEHV